MLLHRQIVRKRRCYDGKGPFVELISRTSNGLSRKHQKRAGLAWPQATHIAKQDTLG
jgi:hypothetical protein